MNLNTNQEIKKAFENAFKLVDTEDLEHESKMVMYRFLSEIERISDEKKLNRKELASLIGTSASYITQLFRGNKLINMETIAKFQKAFDIVFEIKAIPNNAEEAFQDFNIDNLCQKQEEPQGFWAFHKFKQSYYSEPSHVAISGNYFERKTV